MAKPQSAKQANKTIEVTDAEKAGPDSSPAADASTQPASTQPASTQPASTLKKDSARPKKQAAAKSGSLLPSAYKLEQLKAAVKAAGNTENLLMILHHVEEAGGKAEVTESIEAYRMLKTVLEE